MALRHAVHGWDQVTRYVDMTAEEEAAFLASQAQAQAPAVQPTPGNPPQTPPEFTPEPLPEPLEAADQPDDDPIPQFLQTPVANDGTTDEPINQPEPTPPGPGWSVSDLLAAAGPPPTLPAPPPPEPPQAPDELQPLPEQPTEPEPASDLPDGAVLISSMTIKPGAQFTVKTDQEDDPIAEALATQAKGREQEPVFVAPSAPPPASSSVTYREEKTIQDETGWRAEIRYQVAVMAKNGSHKARQKLVGPARRRNVQVAELVEQIIQEREALEHKVLEDF